MAVEGPAGSAVISEILKDDGVFPNNDKLPFIAYRAVLELPDKDPAAVWEALFLKNGWPPQWRSGLYDFHHYHSLSHEVLGCYSGTARVRLGGPEGVLLEIAAGDGLLIPAGVAHRAITASPDFSMVGGYPAGERWDLCYGRQDERPQADRNIAAALKPDLDPVLGPNGALHQLWSS